MKKLTSVETIKLKTGEITTEYVELTDEEYEKYNKRVIQPFAKWLCGQMKRDIETGKFKPYDVSPE
jgi:hypothetical protein